MVEILKKIIEDNLISTREENRLNEDELYILLLSIYLHDLSLEFPLAHGIDDDINKLTEEDLSKMRRNHGKISAYMLENIEKGEDQWDTFLNLNKPEIKNHIPYVCDIISKHQSNEEYSPDKIKHLGNKEIHVGILTGLLRIVDQLDCDYRRVSMEKLHQYSIPPESVLHWLACHYINSISIKYGIIKIRGSFTESLSGPERTFISNELIEKINYELKLCEEQLWANNIKIKLKGEIIPESKDYSFHKIDPPTAVRKLIQDKILYEKRRYEGLETEEEGEARDWMTYWKFNGNPFLDNPLSYGDQFLVETKDFNIIISEIKNKIDAKQGAVKLLIGERGYGKTTLFQIIKGQFLGICPVSIVDAADVVSNVNNGSELKNALFTQTENEVFGIDDIKITAEFDKNKFFEKLSRSKIRVICIDALDRLDNDKILREFFHLSQQILSTSAHNAIIILSCAPEWKSFIDSDDLSYLGYGNQWFLNKFSTGDAKEMITKRLASSRRKFDEIFDENVIVQIQTISNGNPRTILNNTESICRLAFQEKKEIITSKFVEEKYKDVFEGSYTSFLDTGCRKSTKFKEGLIAIHCFFSDLERRNLDINTGCDLLSKLIKGEIKQKMINIQYYTSTRSISTINTHQDDGKSFNYYKIDNNVKYFFDILKKQGYLPKDFLSFYSYTLYIPPDDRGDLKNIFKRYFVVTDDVRYYEQSRIEYNDLSKTVKIGHVHIRKSWNVLENIIVAILIKLGKINEQDYVSKKNSAVTYDHLNRERMAPGYRKILADLSQEIIIKFKEEMKGKRWVHTLPNIQWIRFQRNNILTSRSDSLYKYDERYIDMCKNHLYLSYRELLEIYDKIKIRI